MRSWMPTVCHHGAKRTERLSHRLHAETLMLDTVTEDDGANNLEFSLIPVTPKNRSRAGNGILV
jgi:hypothetical protein